jgi:hypothetical protein
MHRRAGTEGDAECMMDPGSAAHRFALRSIRGTHSSSAASKDEATELQNCPSKHCGARTQHPLQMLGTLPSSNLPCSLTAARAAARRVLDVANRVRLIFTARCTVNVRWAAGGEKVGGITGVIAGGGIAGTLAALPMPLGSLTEPLSPRAFAGPSGMPLTPASWPGDLEGTARRPNTAKVRNAALPAIHPQENIETSCARLIDR